MAILLRIYALIVEGNNMTNAEFRYMFIMY